MTPPSVVVSVFGFEGGASRAPVKARLLLVVVKAGQDQNVALLFRSGHSVARRSPLLQEHDVPHQARDGGVDVGVVLERGRRPNVTKL